MSAAVLTGLALTSSAFAHYLWVTIDAKSGEHGTTNIYFEGGAGSGNGQYNDPIVKTGQDLDSDARFGKAS